MPVPSLREVRQEAERLGQKVPPISRKAASLRELQARAERQRAEAIEELARILRMFDDVIARIRMLSDEVATDRDTLLAQTRELRRRAFENMRDINPEQAWFWTEEWQAGEREVDEHLAAGRVTHFESEAALEAAFAAVDADIERRAHI